MMEWTVPFWVWATQFISWWVMFTLWIWTQRQLRREKQRPDRIDKMVEYYATHGFAPPHHDLDRR